MADKFSLDTDDNSEGYDGEWSQAEIDRQRDVDYHCAHCGPCIRGEECKTLERLWDS
jgi:hypothetical protein